MSSSIRDAAWRYINGLGWSVIPISATSKKPLVKWKEFTQRLPTKDEINAWWRQWPSANLAVITGNISGLVVVDIDPDKGGNADEWLLSSPTALTASTRRGGVHCYYAAASSGEAIRNSVGKLGSGIDVRGEAGYVLAPPSAGYLWRGGSGPAARVQAGLPELGLAHLGERDARRDRATGEHWIERVLQGVGHGERNGACARLAGYFLGKGTPVDVVTGQLIAWNRLNDPPLSDNDVRVTVASVARTAHDRRLAGNPFRDESGSEGEPGYSTIDFAAYLSKYGHQQVRWLVNDWLPEETVGMVVAPPGSYKTWLLQDLAISVATGMPFLGQFPVLRPGPVLFMQQEDWHGQIAHRFALIASHRAGMEQPRMEGDRLILRAPPKIPIHLHEHRRFRFDDEAIVDSWVQTIRRIRPSLVVLDPLYSAGSVDDFMAGTARAMFLFKHIRDSLGTTFLIAHHTRKKPKDGRNGKSKVEEEPEREDVWGSQFLNAWIETGWQIRRREEIGSATILRHFKVQSETAKAVISFNIDTTQLPTRYDIAVREAKGGEEPEADLLRILEINGTMSVAAMCKATKLPRTTIYRRLENLLEAGAVKQSGNRYELKEDLNV